MTREQLKKEALEIAELTQDWCGFLEGIESNAKRLTDLIYLQDAYIDKLVAALIHIRNTNHISRVDDMDLTILRK